MRFKAELKSESRTFSKLIAALSSLEKIAWLRLDDETVRFTVIPDMGSQVWATVAVDLIFETYTIQSAEPNNTINLELPLGPLQRALKSALGSSSANLRLTKRDGVPMLSMTILTATRGGGDDELGSGVGGGDGGGYGARRGTAAGPGPPGGTAGTANDDNDSNFPQEPLELRMRREREKVITQDIPVRVLHPDTVETIMQPTAREPSVNIMMPPLLQLKAISDRFTKLAMAAGSGISGGGSGSGGAGSSRTMNNNNYGGGGGGGGVGASLTGGTASNPRLELSANMHGSLRLRLATETLDIASRWDGLENPELEPSLMTVPVEEHPTTLFRAAGPDRWATVRVDGRDWSRVLSVGRLEGRVIATFADENSLVLYVFVPNYDSNDAGGGPDNVVTYYVPSYSA